MLSKCTAENHSIDEINKTIWILQFICVWITLFYLTELIRLLNLFLFLWSLLFFSLVAVYELQLRHCTVQMMIYFVCISVGRSLVCEWMLVCRLPCILLLPLPPPLLLLLLLRSLCVCVYLCVWTHTHANGSFDMHELGISTLCQCVNVQNSLRQNSLLTLLVHRLQRLNVCMCACVCIARDFR